MLARDEISNEILRRRDMRDAFTFTIDPADAKDFDDALSFECLAVAESDGLGHTWKRSVRRSRSIKSAFILPMFPITCGRVQR